MKDGFYKVKFAVPGGDSGGGIVVVRDNAINGGDEGYLYTGKVNESGDTMTAELSILNHDPNARSVFGNVASFKLPLTGHVTANGFSATGMPSGMPATIAITGTWFSGITT
jgi:hypothetical protein